MALHMSRDVLSIFDGTIFRDSIETLFQKVKSALLPETLTYLENIAGTLRVNFGPTKNFSGLKDIVRALSDAAASRKRVEITYKAVSTGRQTKRKVDPYQVWVMNGAFYLIGFCHVRNAVRTFAMDRIKGFSVLDESFVLPKDFSLEDYLQTAFRVMRGEPQKVKFRLTPGRLMLFGKEYGTQLRNSEIYQMGVSKYLSMFLSTTKLFPGSWGLDPRPK